MLIWASRGDPAQVARAVADHEHQLLASSPESHDTIVIGFSRGAYVPDALLAGERRVGRIEQILLDPTGVKALGAHRRWLL